MANLIDAGGRGAAYARSVVAQAQAAILPEVRRLIDESIGRIAVRAGGNLTAIGIRSALMFDPAATAVVDDPDHEQVIVPLGGGGGGGGSGWSLVERLTVASPTDTLAFASVPTSGDSLMLVSQGSVIVGSGLSGALYGLLLNGDSPTGSAKYRDLYTEVDGYPSSSPTNHYTTFHDPLGVIGNFGASLSGATADNGGGVSICYLPGFTVAKPVTAISHSQNYHQSLGSFGSGAQVIQGTYTFTYDSNGPVTAISIHCGNGGQFAVGTTFALYVLNG